jgi:hypothetical protein
VGAWIETIRGITAWRTSYREFESRLGRVSSGHGSKTDMILNAIDGFIGDFSISDIEKACPT